MNIATKVCPDEIKRAIRLRNFLQEMRAPSRCVSEALDRARKTWTEYELVNRECCPDDPVYSIVNAGAALSTTADSLTFQAASSGQARILELIVSGEATASAVNRVGIGRMGTSITGNSAITPEKFNNLSPAAAGTYGKTGTQALTAGNLLTFAFNAFGGFVRWVAGPGEELYYSSSGVLGLRSLSGTSTCSFTGIFEEL